MIPPAQDGDFVAAMEDVLEVYHRPYKQRVPVVCMDEQPIQLIDETRTPLPMQPRKPKRYDFEYRRAGTSNIFMFTEPLAGWRRVSVRDRKTKIDWAEEIRHLLEVDYPHARKVILICDNLNTHKLGSLYDAFEPQLARQLAGRLEIHHTPKHGSWLNIAECELSAMSRQSLGKRTGSVKSLQQKTSVWMNQRNETQIGVDWQFTTKNARIKLRHLYPQIKLE